MIIRSQELKIVCGITSVLPKNNLPEVALVGRSNVGKSSLINTILKRKSYARTSNKPGKTQTINYYLINDEIFLVDLPGYGYAKISKEMRKKWGKMIETYLTTSEQLRYVFMLLDIRHAPTKDDILMYDWLKYLSFNPIIIATKADKLKPIQIEKNLKIIRDTLNLNRDEKKDFKIDMDGNFISDDIIIVPFSSVTKRGLDTVYDLLAQVIEQER